MRNFGPYHGLQAIVFDLDGTLVDSLPDIAAALNTALSELELRRLDEQAVRAMVGNGSRILVERALAAAIARPPPPDVVEWAHAAFLRAYAQSPCDRSRLYPVARETLEALDAAGLRLGICTNKPQHITDYLLNALAIGHLFGAVIGGSDSAPLKPAPNMLRSVLASLAAAPSASVLVGDGGADAGAARAAGTRLILFEHGYGQEPLHALGADAVLQSFAELPAALMRMTR